MNRMQFALAALAAALCPGIAPGTPLTLAAATDRALAASPAMQAAALGVEIAGNERNRAAQKPPVDIGIEIENVAGTGAFSGFDEAETTLAVSRIIERGNKAELRASAGDQRIALAQIEHSARRLAVSARVERRFYAVLAAQANADTAYEAQRIAGQTHDIVTRRFEIGRSSRADLDTARIRIVRSRLALARANMATRVARSQLAWIWGDPVPDFDAVAGDLLRVSGIPALAEIERDLASSPELERLETEARLAGAEQRVAAAAATVDWELAAGVRYFSEPSDAALLASFSVPLGQTKRAEPLERAAAARAAQAPLAVEQRHRELLARVAALHAEATFLQKMLTTTRDELLPLANEAVARYRDGFERGGYSLLELTEAQNRALDVRQDLVETAAALHSARIELRRLTGRSAQMGASS